MQTIQYLGVRGSTGLCLDALRYVIQQPARLECAFLISFCGRHGFLLKNQFGWWAIRSGFTSGYVGTGPRGLNTALRALIDLEVDLHEKHCGNTLSRIDSGKLRKQDISGLYSNYMPVPDLLPYKLPDSEQRDIWNVMPGIPFALLDSRLHDLARDFFDNPDAKLHAGYCRLEGILRERTGLAAFGKNLFERAFSKDPPLLAWEDCDPGEVRGRANLFISVFQSYRNPRAHNETESSARSAVRELVLLSHLYMLEAEAKTVGSDVAEARY